MKNLFILNLLFAIFIGCGPEDLPPPKDEYANTKSILGKWQLNSYIDIYKKTNGEFDTTIGYGSSDDYMHFMDEITFEQRFENNTEVGTYSFVKDSFLVFNKNNIVHTIKSLTDNELIYFRKTKTQGEYQEVQYKK